MGIGYALASGLVKGFTENIGREMEKRAGEVDRVNKLRDAIIVSSVGDNFNNANVEAIQKMISSADQQIKDRGGIDIFGTRSDDILGDDEMTSLLGSLKSTTEDDEDENEDESDDEECEQQVTKSSKNKKWKLLFKFYCITRWDRNKTHWGIIK